MEIRLIGTGAADWDWSLPLGENVRGSTVTLLDRFLLIDAGPTALFQLQRQNVNLGSITDIFISHSHNDHFNVECIEKIAAASRQRKLRVYASRQALAKLDDSVEKLPLDYGKEITAGNFRITPVPANHALEDLAENAHHFLIDTPEGKRLFYALDGAWMTSVAHRLLMREKKFIDLILWDATCGNTFHDWRFADHNDLAMVRELRIGLDQAGLTGPATRHVFDHVARTLWPESAADRSRLAREFNGILAEDGMTITL